MHLLQIEHAIRDFDTWKMAFDRVDGRRQQSGVRGYRIDRLTDDPNYVPRLAISFFRQKWPIWAKLDV